MEAPTATYLERARLLLEQHAELFRAARARVEPRAAPAGSTPARRAVRPPARQLRLPLRPTIAR
ncbi:MAG: hypothetical protein JOY68_06615 [Candidatus Dormibacteraeota bacterium]|nr:hypothetical protein [Candidatus Dormibacteraeota bacterium]